jgi:hypothetical protein
MFAVSQNIKERETIRPVRHCIRGSANKDPAKRDPIRTDLTEISDRRSQFHLKRVASLGIVLILLTTEYTVQCTYLMN